MEKRNRFIFLDRDGVITADPPHYAHRKDQVHLIRGSAEAIRFLNEQKWGVIVITNQSGVARGMYGEKDIQIFHEEMERQLHEQGAHIDGVYYCPHHPEGIVPAYRMICECRKPKPGMLLRARDAYHIDLSSSILVGDKTTDLQAGRSAGCTTILVLTGHGKEEHEKGRMYADYVAGDLLSAVREYVIPVIL
jgi:D-glycero-D-manno-heptose 1,7-bisphosphate phosphatase